jgi:hypothetical protein
LNQRYSITVNFIITADSAEDAEEAIESICERAASSHAGGEISYEGIEDIEEAEEE